MSLNLPESKVVKGKRERVYGKERALFAFYVKIFV